MKLLSMTQRRTPASTNGYGRADPIIARLTWDSLQKTTALNSLMGSYSRRCLRNGRTHLQSSCLRMYCRDRFLQNSIFNSNFRSALKIMENLNPKLQYYRERLGV